jgi:hypothetical protein
MMRRGRRYLKDSRSGSIQQRSAPTTPDPVQFSTPRSLRSRSAPPKSIRSRDYMPREVRLPNLVEVGVSKFVLGLLVGSCERQSRSKDRTRPDSGGSYRAARRLAAYGCTDTAFAEVTS